jgi:hypothetical protein
VFLGAGYNRLGTSGFEQISNRLRLELRGMGKIDSDRAWDKIQVDFLKKHKFFTKTSISARRKKKKENLKVVIKRLDKDAYED